MGLINGMQQMPPEQPQAQPTPNPASPQGQPAAQGVDDTARKRALLASTKIIYDPATMKAILDMIRNAKSPEEGLARATVLVMAKLAEASKNTMPQAIRTPVAKGVMALIAELAAKAGIIKNAGQAVKRASQMIAQAIMKAANIGPGQPMAAQPNQPMGGQPPMNEAQPAMGAM